MLKAYEGCLRWTNLADLLCFEQPFDGVDARAGPVRIARNGVIVGRPRGTPAHVSPTEATA